MRLHKFRELVDSRQIINLTEEFPREVTEFEGSVQFDFGDVTSVPGEEWKGLQDYAIDLINERMFRMPFDRCFYSFRADGLDSSAVIVEKPNRLFCFLSVGAPDDGAEVYGGALVWTEPNEACGKFKIAYDGFIEPYMPQAYYDDARKRAFFDDTFTVFVRNIFALTMLLSAKGVEQIITPAPHKLNKHRAKRGQPLIGEVREIVIRHDKKVYLSSGQERGSHASPRMHWRRGHLRRLASGEITNVRPCLVGSVGEAPQPSYVVRAA